MKKYFLGFFIFMPVFVFAQRIQLNNIPGEDKGMNISDLLDQIMQPHYTQVSNLKNKRTDKEIEVEIWTGIRTNIENFDRINRYLFSFESPFRDATNTVSDPSVLTVSATRNAEKGTHTLVVKRLAAPDAFSSSPIGLDEALPPSRFTVAVGAETNEVAFPGGDISVLASTLKASLSNAADIELINSSEKTRSLLIRGKQSGKAQGISFDGDLKTLLAAKVLGEGEVKTSTITWNKAESPLALTNESYQKVLSTPILPNTGLSFTASAEEIPPMPEPVRVKIEEGIRPLGEYTNKVELPGAVPLLDDAASVEKTPEEAPKAYVTLTFSGGESEKISLNEKSDHFLPLAPYAGRTLEKIDISYPQMTGSVGNITLTSRPRDDMEPSNPISRAQDALFSYDGVDLERPSNSIGDLTRGVTLELKKESPDRVTFSISPNLELIQNTITQWTLAYNAVVDNAYNATTLSIDKIRDRKVKPLHQRKKDGDDIVEGALLSDTGLLSYRATLRRLVGSPYGSSTNNISLLDQVGIYVQRVRGGAPTDPESIRRGLLTLDTAQLQKNLTENFEDVARLFTGNPDADETAIPGVAVAATQANATMIGGSGYITRNNQNNGDRLRRMSQDITKKEDEIAKTERTERGNLLRMNQALAASKAQSEALRQRLGN